MRTIIVIMAFKWGLIEPVDWLVVRANEIVDLLDGYSNVQEVAIPSFSDSVISTESLFSSNPPVRTFWYEF